MPMIPTLHSLNSLSIEMSLDRRTLAKILRSTPPDGTVKGQPRWRLTTLLEAMENQQPKRRSGNSSSGNPELLRITEKIEAVTNSLDAEIDRLNKIKSLNKRREAAQTVGPLVGELDELMMAANALLPADERAVLGTARDVIVGRTISNLLSACEWQLPNKTVTGVAGLAIPDSALRPFGRAHGETA